MIKSTIHRWFLNTLLIGLTAVSLQARESYLGVYALPLRTTSIEGDLVGYTTEKVLDFEVNVSNEEGREELFFLLPTGGGRFTRGSQADALDSRER